MRSMGNPRGPHSSQSGGAGGIVGPQELLDRHFPFAYPGQTPQMYFLRLLRASTGLGDSHLEQGPPCSDPPCFSPLPSLLLSRITSQISHSTWSLCPRLCSEGTPSQMLCCLESSQLAFQESLLLSFRSQIIGYSNQPSPTSNTKWQLSDIRLLYLNYLCSIYYYLIF